MNTEKGTNFKTIGLHALAVLTFVAYEITTMVLTQKPFNPWVLLCFYSMHIVFFYITAFYFLSYINSKVYYRLVRILMCVLEIVLYSIITVVVYKVIELILKGKYTTDNLIGEFVDNAWRGFYFFFLALCFWYARYSVLKKLEARNQEILRLQAQENELRMEGAFLRSQVNPHQLFNTFTVLYSRLLSKAPEEAKIMLLISDMMEYSLDADVISGQVRLGEDLLQIDREIRLQQVFYNANLKIKYEIKIDDQIKDIKLPPLLFMNFVQNIFKHGDLNDPLEPATITIDNIGNVLHFRTSNKIAPSPNAPSKNTGLNNTRTRLERHYPDRFELLTHQESGLFLVDLKISL
ncbi:sensor histidine kinase [Taibaiella chishuiensis]|uniref:Histidine kinase n=1 Tax=Taibaiella chishuiensis TaxID=1434707 RepID=A0A2P8D0R3_9BACT|nr:histidine kinase [Taibaiella chishuiensis]PSK90809.1 histidine kinase [Taibaiella chishuiensis]